MRKKLQRLLWVAPVAMLLFAGAASAQTTGTIVGVVNDAATGKPVAGALVIATSKSLPGEQTAVTDGRGAYTLTALPPGIYKLVAQLQGFKPAERGDLNLRVDFTLRVNIAMVPEAVQMEEQVVKTGTAPAVNIGTAEAGTIVSREFLSTVPTARTYETVATIAPTAQRDLYGVSFAGATSPENNYIIDGLRVSDPSYGTLGTNLLTNFVDQLDVKVGSFMPEYGYSSAGIINTVTKSGGNEFHGSIWGNLTPGFFTPAAPPIWSNGMAVATQSTPYKGGYLADFGLEVGGPIVKDKLWFYAGFAPQMNYSVYTSFYQSRTRNAANTGWLLDGAGQYVMTPIADTNQVWGNGYNRYFAVAKLTWLVNENNNVFVSFNTQPTNNFGRTSANADPSAATLTSNNNYTNVVLNYTGKFIDKHLLLNVNGGWYNQTSSITGQTINGIDQLNTPGIQWRVAQPLANFAPGFTCPLTNAGACDAFLWVTGGIGYADAPKTNRYAGQVSLTGLFELGGQHQLKGGAQIDYSNYANTRYYTGGGFFYAYGLTTTNPSTPPSTSTSLTGNAFYSYRGYGTVGGTSLGSGRYTLPCASGDPLTGVCTNPGKKDPTDPGFNVANTNTWTNGFYLQDSWTIANVLTLNFGVRLDTQKMVNASDNVLPDAPQLNINNMWAPRVQAIWDFTGTGRGKVQANWGMYYESIPLDMALRAFNGEPQVRGTYMSGTCNNKNNGPSGTITPGFNPYRDCPDVYGLAIGQGPGPNTVNLSARTGKDGLKGFGLTGNGYTAVDPNLKGSYTQQFGGGVQYEVLQDLTLGVDYIGRRMGDIIEDMSSDDGTNYYIANPAVSKPWTVTSGSYAGVTFNPRNATGYDPITNANYSLTWPTPERSYDAVSFTLNKLFSRKWLAQASYTWSSLRGNYPGLFRYENGQLDPNITSEYDLPGFLGNRSGPLVGNRTHQIKAAGSYNATLSSDVTLVPNANIQIFSGYPISANANHPSYGNTESFILPRGFVGDLPWSYQVDLGLKLLWAISGPYTLQFSLDIFNILNMATIQWVDMRYSTADFAGPMQAAQCSTKSSWGANKDVLTALNQNCPDLPYARNWSGGRITPNLNFGQPINGTGINAYQSPISARFGVQLSF